MIPLTIGEVEAVAFFRELPNETYRISLRSKNRVNVARVAEQFGGGGHSNAAGFTLRQVDLPALTADVLAKLKEAVETAQPVNGNGRGWRQSPAAWFVGCAAPDAQFVRLRVGCISNARNRAIRRGVDQLLAALRLSCWGAAF